MAPIWGGHGDRVWVSSSLSKGEGKLDGPGSFVVLKSVRECGNLFGKPSWLRRSDYNESKQNPFSRMIGGLSFGPAGSSWAIRSAP